MSMLTDSTLSRSDSGANLRMRSRQSPFARWSNPGYVGGMNLEAIKDAIVHLSEPERRNLADWFDELEEDAWDRQMEQDSSPGGRGVHLLREVQAEIASGRTKPMDEFLAEAKAIRDRSKTGK